MTAQCWCVDRMCDDSEPAYAGPRCLAWAGDHCAALDRQAAAAPDERDAVIAQLRSDVHQIGSDLCAATSRACAAIRERDEAEAAKRQAWRDLAESRERHLSSALAIEGERDVALLRAKNLDSINAVLTESVKSAHKLLTDCVAAGLPGNLHTRVMTEIGK